MKPCVGFPPVLPISSESREPQDTPITIRVTTSSSGLQIQMTQTQRLLYPGLSPNRLKAKLNHK